jgi:hypothetical protein
MTNQLYPALNDSAPSWADISVTSTVYDGDLLDMVDIKDINWSSTVEVGEQRGASGGRVMARTVGAASQEASMTLYRSGYRKLLKGLMSVAPERGNQKLVSLVGFDIMIQHSPLGETEIYQTKIKGCRLLEASNDNSEGTDADTVEVKLSPLEIVQLIDGSEVTMI